MMIRLGVAVMAAASLSACAGELAEHGFTEAAAPVPAGAIGCAQEVWALPVQVRPDFSDIPAWVSYLRENRHRGAEHAFALHYDVSEAGRAVNIRHEGPDWQLRDSSVQTAIRASADALLQQSYVWRGEGAPRFTTGCVTTYTYALESRTPDIGV